MAEPSVTRRRLKGGNRGQRGAVLVEAAFVLPILVLLVFGIIDYGFVLKDYQSLASATRSGARTASAEARGASYDTDASTAVATAMKALQGNDTPQILEIFQADPATGLPYNSAKTGDEALPLATCSHCSYYTWNSATTSWNAANPRNWPGSGSSSAQDACAYNSSTNPNGPDTLGVYLKVSHKMFTGLFGNTRTLTDKTDIKLEPQPLTSGPCTG